MLLGSLLTRLRDESQTAAMLTAIGDVSLVVRIDEAGAPFGETAGLYAANAAARFSTQASDEDWLGLMTALERSSDPAIACLLHTIHWALRQDAEKENDSGGCGCGSAGGCHA